MFIHIARYSLIIPMIVVGIEYETVDTSIITSSKPSDVHIVVMWLMLTFSLLVRVKFFITVS